MTLARIVLLVGAVWICSTSALLIRFCQVDPVRLAAYRCLLAATLLAPWWWRDWRRWQHCVRARELSVALLPGVLLGIHFIVWNQGARLAPVSNASLIVNMIPAAMPFALFVVLRERLNRAEMLGTAAAIAGLLVLAGGDVRLAPGDLLGDLLCLLAMLLFCCYLVLGRKNRHLPSLWLYLVPLYFTAGICCLCCAAFVTPTARSLSAQDYGSIIGLAVGPTLIGHSSINHCLKHLRGQVVSVVTSLQFVFAALMAYVFLEEVPGWTFYPAALLVIAGVCLAARPPGRRAAAQPVPYSETRP